MNKTLSIDIGRCNMCLSCVEVCPEVFKETELGFINILDNALFSYNHEVKEAIKYCPNDCIKWDII